MIALVLAVLQQPIVQKFPEVDHPGLPGLAAAVEETCGRMAGTRDGRLKRELDLAEVAYHGRGSAEDWAALACARAALAVDGAIAHDGPLMVTGTTWIRGGMNAALESLKKQPANARAAGMLAVLTLADRHPDNLVAITKAIVAAHAAGVQTPGVLRGCSELALAGGDAAAARSCAADALRAGVDSTWHFVRLARLDFRDRDTVTGSRMFERAAGAARDSAARAEMAWQLQWFLSPDEQQAWTTISDSLRMRWVHDRLAERDIRDGQPAGARLAEHFSRLEYALANFSLRLPVSVKHVRDMGAVTPANRVDPDSVRSYCEPQAVPTRPLREYPRWQDLVDDRGVVWLRFGPPARRIRAGLPTCPMADSMGRIPTLPDNPREAWLYEIDGQTLVLNFEAENFVGSPDATRLVAGGLGGYLCGVDAVRCGLTQQSQAEWAARNVKNSTVPGGSIISLERMEQLRQDDRENISVATTKDDNSVRGDRTIDMMSRLHRLWDPETEVPIALVTYALPVKDLSVQTGNSRTAVVDLALRQFDARADTWHDTTVTRRFTLPDSSVKRPALTGFLLMPTSPGVSSWSLVATQPDHRRGRAYDVSTPGLGTGPLALSDLVFGSEAQGLTWNLHNVPVPLAPINAVDRATTVALYYQIKAAAARNDLRTTVALYRRGGTDTMPALEVSYDQAVQGGINEVAPTLDLSRLDKGSYYLEVRVSDTKGATLTRRRAELVLE